MVLDPTRSLGGLGAVLNLGPTQGPAPQFTAGGPVLPPGMGAPPPPATGVGPAAPAPAPVGTPGAPPPQVPGISGITPGAIERRLGFSPPTMQANPMAGMNPTAMAARTMSPNITGVDPGAVRSPLAGIQQLLAQRGGNRGNSRQQ